MKNTKALLHRKASLSLGVAITAIAIGGATFVASGAAASHNGTATQRGRTAVTRNERLRGGTIAPQLRREFAVFSGHSTRASLATAASVAAGYPALEQQLETMMQANDPSAQFHLDFAAAQLEQTQQGPAIVVPGSAGACMIMQVPSTAHQVSAASACNYTANIARSSGLGATYAEPPQGIRITFGMAANYTATADLVSGAGSVRSMSIKANVFAADTEKVDHVVLRRHNGRVVRVLPGVSGAR